MAHKQGKEIKEAIGRVPRRLKGSLSLENQRVTANFRVNERTGKGEGGRISRHSEMQRAEYADAQTAGQVNSVYCLLETPPYFMQP